MDFVKRYPLLTAILAVCVAVFAAELFFLWKFSSDASTLQSQLTKSQAATKQAAQVTPAPSQQNLDDATKNVEDLKSVLAGVDNTLQNTPQKIEYVAPPKDTDPGAALISDIQKYVDSMSSKASDKGVFLPSKTYGFGMALYVGNGVSAPPADKIPAVYTQLKVLDYIVSHLLDDAKLPDQKMKIMSIEREDVASVVAPGAAPAPTNENGSSGLDLFVLDPTVTARVPGAINTLAFRIKFVGYTESLRILLNDLAKFDLPLVVRSISVEPPAADVIRTLNGQAGVSASVAAAGTGTADSKERRPVITENFSQFTLIIEYIELPAPPAPAADASAAPAPAGGTAPAAPAASADSSAKK